MPCPQPFASQSVEEINALLNANIKSLTVITYVVLNGMLQRNKGLVLNVSAFSGLYPVPYISAYSASKVSNATLVSFLCAYCNSTLARNRDRISGVHRIFFEMSEYGIDKHGRDRANSYPRPGQS